MKSGVNCVIAQHRCFNASRWGCIHCKGNWIGRLWCRLNPLAYTSPVIYTFRFEVDAVVHGNFLHHRLFSNFCRSAFEWNGIPLSLCWVWRPFMLVSEGRSASAKQSTNLGSTQIHNRHTPPLWWRETFRLLRPEFLKLAAAFVPFYYEVGDLLLLLQ